MMPRTCVVLALLLSGAAHGDVLEDGLTPRQTFGMTLEGKWAKARDSDARSLAFKPELTYGATDTAEVLLGVPREVGESTGINIGVKWLPWQSAGGWFAGAQLERSWIRDRDGATGAFTDLKSIIGLRRGAWQFAANPILSWSNEDDHSRSRPHFSAALRLARDVGKVNVGLEYATEVGTVGRFGPWRSQSRTLSGTVGGVVGEFDIRLELGRGMNSAADRFNGRLTLSRAL